MIIPAELQHEEVLAEDVKEGDMVWLGDYKFTHNQHTIISPATVSGISNSHNGDVLIELRDVANKHCLLTCHPSDPIVLIIQ